MMQWIVENATGIYLVLAAAHALAVAIVNLTPTPEDNRLLAKVYPVIEAMAGILTTTAKQFPGESKIIKQVGGAKKYKANMKKSLGWSSGAS